MSTPNIPDALRSLVIDRAKIQCEYCLTPQTFAFVPYDIDHIIAQKHGGLTVEENLALACSICNQYKGSDIASIDPESGKLTGLFHPRKHIWNDHFELSKDGHILPKTPTGRVTTRLLKFNHPTRVLARAKLMLAGVL